MAVTIIIPTALRQYAGGSSELAVEARTIGEALDSLTSRHMELRKHLYSDQNALRSFVNIYVNDEDIRHVQRLETPVRDGDTVMIVPSIAGGLSTVDEIETTDLPSLSNEEIARYSRHLITGGSQRIAFATRLFVRTLATTYSKSCWRHDVLASLR